MSFFVICDLAGLILKNLEMPDQETADLQCNVNETAINVESQLDEFTQYIVGPGTTNTVTARPLLSTVVSWNKTSIIADGSDAAVLSSIPNPSIVSISVPDGVDPVEDLTVVDGILTVTSDAPVDYFVRVASFPYQLYEQKITAS